MRIIIGLIILTFMFSFSQSTFKEDQLKYPRVRKAYQDKEANVKELLKENDLEKDQLRIYLRAFKQEKKIELWAKNNSADTYQLIKEYEVCETSGKLGPKREQGDLQIPEGFYHINRFNPYSTFYLSLGINYPNTSDRILGVNNNLGSDIFIHGNCVTIGCLPITDEKIKELYIFCVEAKNNGQDNIPVTIFPSKLNAVNFSLLQEFYKNEKGKIDLWTDLKKGFDIFNETKKLPNIDFLPTGRHEITK